MVQNEPPGEGEVERSILLEAPSLNMLYNKIKNNFNGVNTVFLNYKLCIFLHLPMSTKGNPYFLSFDDILIDQP